ncbi:hypothetical protein H4219_000999 [Mycoemilia scoparia]|uniref:non-specific serine/threonine protein kinase n=1 Tax=Mycoemilia scoparia TaxID=417184 RepID=A0A9W8AAQ0_9FUNG|nr:hypothetical protein H4219_000999 [Mycoemilia scoparia]
MSKRQSLTPNSNIESSHESKRSKINDLDAFLASIRDDDMRIQVELLAKKVSVEISETTSDLATLCIDVIEELEWLCAQMEHIHTKLFEFVYEKVVRYVLKSIEKICIVNTSLRSGSPLELRLAAWVYLPLACKCFDAIGINLWTELEEARVYPDDPQKLLEAVSSIIGYIPCAVLGTLTSPEDLHMQDISDSNGNNLWTQFEYSPISSNSELPCYICRVCDEWLLPPSPDTKVAENMSQRTISLRNWLSFWFIVSNQQPPAARVNFVHSISRFVHHTSPEDISLEASPFGINVLKMYSSRLRELRFAVNSVVRAYVCSYKSMGDETKSVLQANRESAWRHIIKCYEEKSFQTPMVEEALLMGVTIIGGACSTNEPVLQSVVEFLVKRFCGPNLFLKAVAYEQLMCLSKEQNCHISILLGRYSRAMSYTIAQTLDADPHTFNECMHLMNASPRRFIKSNLETILPQSIIEKKERLMHSLANVVQNPLPVLCINYGHHILSKIFVLDDEEMKLALVSFLKIVTAGSPESTVTIANIVRSCSVQLVFSLIMELGSEDIKIRQRGYNALKFVQKTLGGDIDEPQPPRKASYTIVLDDSSDSGSDDMAVEQTDETESTLSRFLARHLLSILAYINEILQAHRRIRPSHTSAHSGRVKALRALKKVIAIIGEEISLHLASIVASLSAPLKNKDLALLTIDVWQVLANTLNNTTLPCETLNTLLVPLIEVFSKDSGADVKESVAKVIKTLILSRKAIIKGFWPLLCPIPRHTLLSDVRELIDQLQEDTTAEKHISYLSQLLKHNNSVVVWRAAEELLYILQTRERYISKWKLNVHDGSSASNQEKQAAAKSRLLLAELLGTLTIACGTVTSDLPLAREACAACIGQIGAVEYTDLSRDGFGFHSSAKIVSSKHPDIGFHDLSDPEDRLELCCELIIDHLAPAFGFARSPHAQASAAFVIQELLKLLGFSQALAQETENDKSETAKKGRKKSKRHTQESEMEAQLRIRWETMPSNIVTMIKPLLSSKYAIRSTNRSSNNNGGDDNTDRVPNVLEFSSCNEWASTWLLRLISLVEDEAVKSILNICTSVIRGSIDSITMYLLPLVIVHLVDIGAKSRNSKFSDVIREELLAVLKAKRDSNSKMPFNQHNECNKAVFKLIDYFEGILQKRKNERSAANRSSRSKQTANTLPAFDRSLKDLLDSIPHLTIADAAYTCEQYTRSLKHYEIHIRDSATGIPWYFKVNRLATSNQGVDFADEDTNKLKINDIEKVLGRIQHIYTSMNEVDGISGCAARRSVADLELDILWWESQGNWTQAQVGYEALLRLSPNSETARLGWTRCLLRMGKLGAAWSTSREWRTTGRVDESNTESDIGKENIYSSNSTNCEVANLSNISRGLEKGIKRMSLDMKPKKSECPTSDCEKENKSDIDDIYSAASWRLGRWDECIDTAKTHEKPDQSLVNVDCNGSFDAGIGKILANFSVGLNFQGTQHSGSIINQIVRHMRSQVARDTALKVAEEVANIGREHLQNVVYSKSISSVVQMHMLTDIEILEKHILANGHGKPNSDGRRKNISSTNLRPILRSWIERLGHLPRQHFVQEPLISLHHQINRILLENGLSASDGDSRHTLSKQSAILWHQLIDSARSSGAYSTALSYLLQIETTQPDFFKIHPELYLEKALVLWDSNHRFDAVKLLQEAVRAMHSAITRAIDNGSTNSSGNSLPSLSLTLPQNETEANKFKSVYIDAALQLGDWQEELHIVRLSDILSRFSEILKVQESDKAHYTIGKFYGKVYRISTEKSQSNSGKGRENHSTHYSATVQHYLVRHFSRTLLYSTRYLFQAMPRLLMAWMDFGQSVLEPPSSKDANIVNKFNVTNRMVSNLPKRLPAYTFLMTFSQIVSRICHPNENVFAVIESIIKTVLLLYPQQALWQLMAVSRSTYRIRAERCDSILAMVQSDPEANSGPQRIDTLIQQFMKLNNKLLDLCNKPTGSRSVSSLSMIKDFASLYKMAPVDIVIPIQSSLTPQLPTHSVASPISAALDTSTPASASQSATMHKPFLANLPTIASFEDQVSLMNSLIRPKKITIVGSDGRKYGFLCKPKDDLRKDSRLMEFNSMINHFLNIDMESRKRSLHIRTYSVVPLNEECGLIQWINNMNGIRPILLKIYRAKDLSVPQSTIKNILELTKPSPEEVFLKKLLPRFPPVLYEWFLSMFPDLATWYLSRTTFARTTAVMSIVGYVLGLGDRHGENILLDEKSGEAMHVDFNCLFEKGLQLHIPEKVPFRLTHNMVDAMGATGYEGAFRISCEVTLHLLRNNRDALMSVLRPFLHDPLCEWSKHSKSTRSPNTGEIVNDHASKSLKTIENKLQGIGQSVFPLSVEGHVDELIREATDPKNLFKMYIGWAAFM